jgi:eukaryotic-like serine/threonine-protein kinase
LFVVQMFANRYEVFEALGSGGFGVVRRAHDRHLRRDVALKLFVRPDASLWVATREAQILTALEGRHILRVFNADTYQDVPYLTTEIAALGSTADRMGALGVRPDLAVRWVRQMLIGLGVCHARGLLHRDVKSSNIFLQTDEHALLGDFGVAILTDSSGGADAHGDPCIRAPECYTAGRMTRASDIYSAGLALYTLLAGIEPFARPTGGEIEAAVVGREFAPLRDVAPHVPRVIAMRVERAMAVDPVDRFASAADYHDALGGVRYLDRLFHPVGPHVGHHRCWSGGRAQGRAGVSVCVSQTGRSFEIDVRRDTPARTRMREWCGVVLGEKQLGVRLRQIFDRV